MRPFLFAVLLSTAAIAQAPEPLFDGESLTGWRGDTGVWRVEGGCLVGSTVGHAIESNTFLIWQGGEVADFELAFDVQLVGNNSGVQYRSRVLPGDGFAVAGYQCDVHPEPAYFGQLYEERGGGILGTQGQFVARDAEGHLRLVAQFAQPVKQDVTQWHHLRILARGPVVQHELDGQRVLVLRDDARGAARSGVIALQVHAGEAMTVRFKNLTLLRLPTEEIAALPPLPVAAAPATKPSWIWDQAPADGEEVFFRREFDVPAGVTAATLVLSCDNHSRVYVNGEKVATTDDWTTPLTVNVAKMLRPGRNALAVHGWNDGGPAALALRLWWSAGGKDGELVSDGAWRCLDEDPDGWNAPAFDDAKWPMAKVYAVAGDAEATWTRAVPAAAFAGGGAPDAPQLAVPAMGLSGPAANGALQLLEVPRAFGSWVALCADDKGRLYASDQSRGLYRVVPAKAIGLVSTIEKVDVDLGGAQGLCWFRGALYAGVNGRDQGLYRITDTDGDDRLDHVELLRALGGGGGEHGVHAVVPAPDGEHLMVLCGNHVPLTELAASRVPTNWGEDRLLPKIEDPNGHANGLQAPGGCVYLVDPDGARWELWCCGFRNAYDLAVLPTGDVLTYDADMEWDMGTPWYRPTRILKVLPGVDYGWRSGSNKWPADYPDAPRPVCDIGPGSPTGMLALGVEPIALDWTFGTVYGIDLTLRLYGSPTPVLTGTPLPVVDAVACQDGFFLATGGRGLPTRLYRVARATTAWKDVTDRTFHLATPLAGWEKRDEIAMLAELDGMTWEELLARLRFWDEWGCLARVALERQPVDRWRAAVGSIDGESGVETVLGLMLALARQGVHEDLSAILDGLGTIDRTGWEVSATDKDPTTHRLYIAWLRVHALALLRLGPATETQRQTLIHRLLPLFPTHDDRVDQDLAELLVYLDAPGFLDKAIPLLSPLRPATPPAWASTIARNASYGGAISAMLADMPPTGQIALAYALRCVQHGWTLDQRRAFFTFLAAARTKKGGASYDGYLKHMVDDAWGTCSEAEQRELADLVGKAKADLPKFAATPPKGPGRQWQLAEALAAIPKTLAAADLASGRNLFHAVGCASCHYFAGEGGNHGPDLTSLGNKFAAADVLESILEPSKVVSDQYSGTVVTRRDGSTLFGRAAKVTRDGREFYEVVPAVAEAQPVQVPVADVALAEPSKLSPMPTNLVDRLSPEELRDLVAFLLSRGQEPPPK